jgi:malyl-CoA/(S)-citramalyl-CoA lyase
MCQDEVANVQSALLASIGAGHGFRNGARYHHSWRRAGDEADSRYRQTHLCAGARYVETPLDMFAYPMMRVLVAARAFDLRAIDGPCGAYRDATLTRAWAEKAAALGFDGKQVIHPSQIEATRDAFTPSPEELAFAMRIVDAMRQAEAEGRGAVAVDGKLIDYANLRTAQRIFMLGAVDRR